MPIKVLVVAATGGLGSAIVRHAVGAGHAVSVLVRSGDDLADRLKSTEAAAGLAKVVVGDASDPAVVAAALAGQEGGFDAVVVAVGAQAKAVVENTIAQVATASPQPALVMTGGSPALVTGDGKSAVEAVFGGADWAQGLRDLHLGTTFAALEASAVERYCMLCPGTMKASDDGKPHGDHGFRPNVIDPAVSSDAATYDDVAVGAVHVAVDLAAGGEAYKNGKLALTAPSPEGLK
jgi:NAD(P)-dependent dehydrogenase (short-subunit alcohol dehydrogenase family)